MPIDLAAIRARLDAYHAGPPTRITITGKRPRAPGDNRRSEIGHVTGFLAHAPADLRALLDEVERLRGLLDDPGVLAIAEERLRQKQAEGWTAEHDDQHGDGQLVDAAVCYLLHRPGVESMPDRWPWGAEWWKPKDLRRNLVRAGAMIAADLGRIGRLYRRDYPEENPRCRNNTSKET